MGLWQPGTALPWRVVRLPASSLARSLKLKTRSIAAAEDSQDLGTTKRVRAGKKRRIMIRKKHVVETRAAEMEKEKRARRNREKRLKKREKNRKLKGLDAEKELA
jgi:hypothetical protein